MEDRIHRERFSTRSTDLSRRRTGGLRNGIIDWNPAISGWFCRIRFAPGPLDATGRTPLGSRLQSTSLQMRSHLRCGAYDGSEAIVRKIESGRYRATEITWKQAFPGAIMVNKEPAEEPAEDPTKDHQGRGRFFPTRPTSDPLEFATELITSLMPGRIGKVIAIAVWLIGASLIVLEWFQWMRH